MVLEVGGSTVALQRPLGRAPVVVELGHFDVFHDDPSRSKNYKFGGKKSSGAKTNRGGWEADVDALPECVWVKLVREVRNPCDLSQ
jgi:hypothetical protein